MAVNVYDELLALGARLTAAEAKAAALEARVLKLETPPVVVPPQSKLGLVSYFRSTTLWDKVAAVKPALAMINPGSGPGPGADSLYAATVVPKCKAAGVPVFGYVHSKGPTGYGTRPLADVKADILNHIAWYKVDGIFVDTTSNDPAFLAYYTDICTFVHGKGLKVVLNCGTKTYEGLAKICDYLCVVETDAMSYETLARPAWEAGYSNLWHMVHSCAATDMPRIVALAKQRKAGLITVTNDVMPNPYDTLPTYIDALVTELAK